MTKSILENKGLIKAYVYERNLNHVLSKLNKLVFIGLHFSYNKCRNGESPYGCTSHIAKTKSMLYAAVMSIP